MQEQEQQTQQQIKIKVNYIIFSKRTFSEIFIKIDWL